MPAHPLTNFKVQNFYENEPKLYGFYLRNNLTKIKDGAYVINLNVHESVGTHLTALYVNNNNITYFDSFRVEYIPKGFRKLWETKIP